MALNLKTIAPLLPRAVWISAIPILVAMILSGVVSFEFNSILKRSRDAVDHSFQVLSKIDATLLLLQDAETGQRGFIITGDQSYLAPFAAAESQLVMQLSELDKLVSDNAEQKLRIVGLGRLATAKFVELNETIRLRRQQGIEAARLSVLRNSGKEMMDQMRHITDEIRRNEQVLLDLRLKDVHWAEGLILLVAVIGVALTLCGRLIAAFIRARLTKGSRGLPTIS